MFIWSFQRRRKFTAGDRKSREMHLYAADLYVYGARRNHGARRDSCRTRKTRQNYVADQHGYPGSSIGSRAMNPRPTAQFREKSKVTIHTDGISRWNERLGPPFPKYERRIVCEKLCLKWYKGKRVFE